MIKVGGSLLARPDLTESLARWLEQQTKAQTLVLVGGGPIVDAVRDLDRLHPGDPEEIHWLCVELLHVTFQLLSGWFPWPTIASPDEFHRALLRGFDEELPTLVAVRCFYDRHQDPLPPELPNNWETTSDSIAAWLALRSIAHELVILKSCAVDPKQTLGELAAAGIVDEAFPMMARRLTKVVNLATIRIERLE